MHAKLELPTFNPYQHHIVTYFVYQKERSNKEKWGSSAKNGDKWRNLFVKKKLLSLAS